MSEVFMTIWNLNFLYLWSIFNSAKEVKLFIVCSISTFDFDHGGQLRKCTQSTCYQQTDSACHQIQIYKTVSYICNSEVNTSKKKVVQLLEEHNNQVWKEQCTSNNISQPLAFCLLQLFMNCCLIAIFKLKMVYIPVAYACFFLHSYPHCEDGTYYIHMYRP